MQPRPLKRYLPPRQQAGAALVYLSFVRGEQEGVLARTANLRFVLYRQQCSDNTHVTLLRKLHISTTLSRQPPPHPHHQFRSLSLPSYERERQGLPPVTTGHYRCFIGRQPVSTEDGRRGDRPFFHPPPARSIPAHNHKHAQSTVISQETEARGHAELSGEPAPSPSPPVVPGSWSRLPVAEEAAAAAAAAAAVSALGFSGAAAGLAAAPSPAPAPAPAPAPHSPVGERFGRRDDVAERLEGVVCRKATTGR